MFSIGYGNRKFEDFVILLKWYGIDTLIDIRSKPVSRFQPAYNKARLSENLKDAGIHYIFMGAELGAKPKDEKYYVNGRISYERIKTTTEYQNALKQLIQLSEQGKTICTMCCELKPAECHRKGLVGESLFEIGVITNHITETGACIPHTREIELKLL